jgi:phosphate transport system substrate-binding protein
VRYRFSCYMLISLTTLLLSGVVPVALPVRASTSRDAVAIRGTGSSQFAHITRTSVLADKQITIRGAGSTLVAPLMIGQWKPDYTAQHAGVNITYDPIGSTKGISTWIAGGNDFAASDALMSTVQEQSAATRCKGAIVKFPVTVASVALIFNVPGVRSGLHVAPSVIAGIFLGRIRRWNDSAIAALNPGVRLPNLAIQVEHRSDGSGTSFILTNYLSEVSTAWKASAGAGTQVNWPVGTGAKGSAGMVLAVSTTLGSIGYVDLSFAAQNNLDYLTVQNAHGELVAPGVNAAEAAANGYAPSMPADLQQVIVNSAATGAYPITGYSYLFLCATQPAAQGLTLVDFVRYVVTQGQSSVRNLFYAPLPAAVQRRELTVLGQIKTG